MIKNWSLKSGILIFVFFVLFGCVSLPQPDEMKAQVATYQLPKLPEEGKAIIYVVRPSSSYKVISFNVFLDNQNPQSEMGYTMGSQYIYFNLTPGEHKILSKGENWAEINVLAKAGDVIFLQQEPAMPILRGARNKLLNIQDYEGKYYIKTLTRGTFSDNNQQNIPTISTPANIGQNAKADTYIGTVTGGNFAKGVGFSNINYKLEIRADNGDKDIFFIRSDSKVVDVSGTQIDWKTLSGFKGKKVEIEYFTITDGTGGDPSRNDFAYEIGKKGVRLLQFLN